jgi:cephalosporin-C deacetylase
MERRPSKADTARSSELRDRDRDEESREEPALARLTRPSDFWSFWAKTRAELEKIPLDVSREPFWTQDPALLFEGLSFCSLGGARISGYAIRWRDNVERPLVVHGHGYGGGLEFMWHWARRGVNVLGVEVRGYGRSKEALATRSPYGYILTGVESPEGHVLRGTVCDYARAVEVGRELLGSRTSRMVLQGASFAGGLAVMVEGLLGISDLLVVSVPSLGWVEGRRSLASGGSGREIRRYLEEYPEREEAVMNVLSYFDSMNFAPEIYCPTIVGVGVADNVVPAPNVYAIAEHLAGPYEVVTWPASHASLPEEDFFRERFEAYWLRLANEGVPEGFGKTT